MATSTIEKIMLVCKKAESYFPAARFFLEIVFEDDRTAFN